MNDLSLELHYHLRDDAHAMNAFIRNKCEAEALAAFQYITEQLGIQLTVETSAHTEGGLRETWIFITKPEHAYTNFMLMLSLLLNTFVQVWNAPPKPDKELETINKEIAKATLQERQLAIEKAKKELQRAAEPVALPPPAAAPAASAAKSSRVKKDLTIGFATYMPLALREPAPTINRKAMTYLAADPRFTTRRSNFYTALLTYDKVTAVGIGVMQDKVLEDERVVKKEDFVKYVLKTDKVPVTVVEEAVIQIVAPVIDNSGVRWKGTYQGEPINFVMKDDGFKARVLRREESFKHGDAIRCRLSIEQKLDETGDVVVTGHTVDVVIEKIDETGVVETPQGRQQRFIDKQVKAQQPLFNLNERTDT